MKKRVVAAFLVAVMGISTLAGCGGSGKADGSKAPEASAADETAAVEEGKVINIYSWNDEFRQRVEAVYSEVEKTSDDGTVTTLKDGTEIHWIVNRTRMVFTSRSWMRLF